jgi:hypothetical protein
MQMLLIDGTMINDAPKMSDKTRKYLNQFWKFPSREESEKVKEKYYIVDYKRECQRKDDVIEHETDI